MVKEFGKNSTDRLFPEINSSGKSNSGQVQNSENTETKTEKS
jgi:hypothetical protein